MNNNIWSLRWGHVMPKQAEEVGTLHPISVKSKLLPNGNGFNWPTS